MKLNYYLIVSSTNRKNPIKIVHKMTFNLVQNYSSAVLKISNHDKVRNIRMDRPAKKNAMNDQMWRGLTQAIKEADHDESTHVITISGNDNYFSAGVDLMEYKNVTGSQFSSQESSLQFHAQYSTQRLINFTKALIDCKKPIVGLVQGKAFGIGVTMLPLCDLVYASHTATFTTPVTSFGIIPACCSSYTFPSIMGYARASKLLLLNEPITAQQAQNWNLVTQIFPHQNFNTETHQLIQELSQIPLKVLVHSKKLVRDPVRKLLHEVNEKEAGVMKTLLESPEVGKLVQKFYTRKITKYLSNPY